jgi:hypothetical protein
MSNIYYEALLKVLKYAKQKREEIEKRYYYLLQNNLDDWLRQDDELSKQLETANKNVKAAKEAVKRMKCIGCKNLVLALEPDGMGGYLNSGSLPAGVVQGYTQQNGDGLLCAKCNKCRFCGDQHDHPDECCKYKE